MRVVATAGILLLSTAGNAQTQIRIPVLLMQDGKDAVGKQVVSDLRSLIGSSARLKLVEALPLTAPCLVVHLDTVDPDDQGDRSIVSVAISYDARNLPLLGYLVSFSSMVCAHDRLQQCSRQALSHLDAAIGFVQLENRHLWQDLRQ